MSEQWVFFLTKGVKITIKDPLMCPYFHLSYMKALHTVSAQYELFTWGSMG